MFICIMHVSTCAYICMYVYMYAYMYVCLHVCIDACMHVSMYGLHLIILISQSTRILSSSFPLSALSFCLFLLPPPRTWQSNFEECRDYWASHHPSVPLQKIRIRPRNNGITTQPTSASQLGDASSQTCSTSATVIRSLRHRNHPVWSQGA